MSSICVIGAGYVGLPTAACFAHVGNDVVCVDRDHEKIARLARGHVTVLEADLPKLVEEGLANGRLRFAARAADVVADVEFVFLCLPTPQGPAGDLDLSAIETAVREVATKLRPGSVVVTKSTVPVGATASVARMLELAGARDVSVVSNPEFLREGLAVREFLHPHRVVIGADDREAANRVANLYRALDAPVVITDAASAEMIKYASNAFLATKISFVNELANACEAVGADIGDVVEGIGRDPRIGFGWLAPGPGWGGPCFPKDTAALLHATSTAGYEFDLVRSALAVNERQRERVAAKISAATSGIRSPRVAVWGLAFKAGTDDIRESPALSVVRTVMAAGARVRAYDPAVGVGAKGLDDIEIAEDPYTACEGADVLAVLTEWDAFRQVDLERVGASMASRRIVDGRNALDVEAALAAGFEYEGVGRRVA